MLYTGFHAIRKGCLLVRKGCDWGCGGWASTVKRTTSEPKRSPTSSSDPSAKNDPNAEVTVQDSGTTFRLRLNLVQVHVVTVKRSFDSSPGKYLVRQVIRDSEGSQMPAPQWRCGYTELRSRPCARGGRLR